MILQGTLCTSLFRAQTWLFLVPKCDQTLEMLYIISAGFAFASNVYITIVLTMLKLTLLRVKTSIRISATRRVQYLPVTHV